MSNYKILLVEDALHWRKILNNYINTAINNLAGNAHISEAESLEQAWDMLENDRWDLLCTDIGLSVTAGATEGTLLVSRASEKNIPTIIVSGTPSVTPQHVRDFLKKYKVADFLYKQTFNSLEFVQLVEHLLKAKDELVKVSSVQPPLEGLRANNENFSDKNIKCFVIYRNFDVAQEIRTVLLNLGIEFTDALENSNLCFVELPTDDEDENVKKINNRQGVNILYYCDEESQELIDIDASKIIVLIYNKIALIGFLESIKTWILFNM